MERVLRPQIELDIVERGVLHLVVVREAEYAARVSTSKADKHIVLKYLCSTGRLPFVVRSLQRMHVGWSSLAFALKILATDQTAVNVLGAECRGTLLVKIEVEHVSRDLPEIGTAYGLNRLFCVRSLRRRCSGRLEQRAEVHYVTCHLTLAFLSYYRLLNINHFEFANFLF